MLEPAPVPYFYTSKRFVGETGRKVTRSDPGAHVDITPLYPAVRAEMRAYFDETTFERHGVLAGEYLLFPDCLTVISRDGTVLKINSAAEDRSGARALDAQIRSPDYVSFKHSMISSWDSFPLAENLPVLSEKYCNNYYHFSLEFLPRLRFLDDCLDKPIMVPESCMAKPFQVDLLGRGLRGRVVVPVNRPIRVRDPILACDMMSENGLAWLRRETDLGAATGSRRVYLRRSGQGTRSLNGGNLLEDEAFLAVLQRFGFETVEFGNGDLSLAEQIALLEGAGTILAPHGAALTNLIYLNGPATVIEIMGMNCARACYMHLCSYQGFRYHGLISGTYDEAGSIVVDVAALEDALDRHL